MRGSFQSKPGAGWVELRASVALPYPQVDEGRVVLMAASGLNTRARASAQGTVA
ncbi:MAG TPA: hypothetical protein VJG32_19290 [Anaerolineae bacterium]|nr:hypothetical protein [Anaerolineae bacterium]